MAAEHPQRHVADKPMFDGASWARRKDLIVVATLWTTRLKISHNDPNRRIAIENRSYIVLQFRRFGGLIIRKLSPRKDFDGAMCGIVVKFYSVSVADISDEQRAETGEACSAFVAHAGIHNAG